MRSLLMLILAFAASDASASVCVVSTAWDGIYCDGKKTAKLEDYIKKPPTPEGAEVYALITAAIADLQSQGYKLVFVTPQSDGKEYTLTK